MIIGIEILLVWGEGGNECVRSVNESGSLANRAASIEGNVCTKNTLSLMGFLNLKPREDHNSTMLGYDTVSCIYPT